MILRTPLALLAIILGTLALSACGEKAAETAATLDAAKPAESVATGAVKTLEAAQALADGAHSGKAIHDTNCISCHDSGVYTRADHKMQDFTQLAAQVRRCDANLGARLLDEDIDKVVDYLNDTYYKFEKK